MVGPRSRVAADGTGCRPYRMYVRFCNYLGEVFAYNELATAWSDILAYGIANAKPVMRRGVLGL